MNGAPKHLPSNGFEPSDYGSIKAPPSANLMVLALHLEGHSVSSIHVRVRMSTPDRHDRGLVPCVTSVSDGVILVADAQWQLSAPAVGWHSLQVPIVPGMRYTVEMMRTGGSPCVTVFAVADLLDDSHPRWDHHHPHHQMCPISHHPV